MKRRRIFSLLLAGLLLFMTGAQAYATETYPTVTTINLPGSDIRLVLPDDLQAIEDRYDELTDREMVVYFITPKDDESTVFMTLTAIRKEAYQGKMLHDLNEQELAEEIGGRTHGFGALDTYWYAGETIVPKLLVRESLGTGAVEGYQMVASNFYYLFAMWDGWLVYAEAMDAPGLGPVERLLTMQLRFIESMIANIGVTMAPDSWSLGTRNGAIDLDLPQYGHISESSETGITVTDMRSYHRRYHFSTTFLGDDESVTLEDLRAYYEPLVYYEGETVRMEIMEESPLGVPMAMLHTESATFYVVYGIVDGCAVTAILTTEGTEEITREDIDFALSWLSVS